MDKKLIISKNMLYAALEVIVERYGADTAVLALVSIFEDCGVNIKQGDK